MRGGYLAADTALHRLPAGAKLAGLALGSIALLPLQDPRLLALALALVLVPYAALGRRGMARLTQWAPLVPLLAIIGIIQALAETPAAALASVLRILAMVLMADLVTLSTRLDDMMEALGVVLRPLGAVGLDPRRLALAVALVLRFVPVLAASWRAREEAWRARSPRRPRLAVFAAFFAGALRGADQVAEALDARGFSSHRTRRRP
ncbi:energy-coupling factor transporter transmembrane component T family protein [Xanthobacter tagetidis]|uniref:Energy-coupling factor transporter transmembrane protein EcfT n=1 Tax=Xanthobacter tagetidis TaxID=60216 RepID=A0A3L7AG97_9HYPH|nr:energy-coupling factor transporter transmembrane component T [Xanthobacter tagetidis]MBB6308549.1 biotin transport system permease protein [Xanthobacter tagetidis]RLP78681.1 energy-coupling factor transporter transmembrane protein EcfT [Xanthobacter tagetidis]